MERFHLHVQQLVRCMETCKEKLDHATVYSSEQAESAAFKWDLEYTLKVQPNASYSSIKSRKIYCAKFPTLSSCVDTCWWGR
jgi:hypothetical protein